MSIYYIDVKGFLYCEQCVCRWNVEFVRYRTPKPIRDSIPLFRESRLKQKSQLSAILKSLFLMGKSHVKNHAVESRETEGLYHAGNQSIF